MIVLPDAVCTCLMKKRRAPVFFGFLCSKVVDGTWSCFFGVFCLVPNKQNWSKTADWSERISTGKLETSCTPTVNCNGYFSGVLFHNIPKVSRELHGCPCVNSRRVYEGVISAVGDKRLEQTKDVSVRKPKSGRGLAGRWVSRPGGWIKEVHL